MISQARHSVGAEWHCVQAAGRCRHPLRNLHIDGLGGVILSFVVIKVTDVLLVAIALA